jgi:hypothetical protein
MEPFMKNQRFTHEELVIKECRAIATEILEKFLSARSLPLPKDSALELHVDQLIATNPDIKAQAKLRVEARTDAYSESLRRLGIELPTIAQGTLLDL